MRQERVFDITVIGDVAYQNDYFPDGTRAVKQPSGSAYYVAAGASLVSERVGVVARVGKDFDLRELAKWGVDTAGVVVMKKSRTAQFVNYQNTDGSRSFQVQHGVPNKVGTKRFPEQYLTSTYIHLATSLPTKQRTWMELLKSRVSEKSSISVDTFEVYARSYPELTCELFGLADIAFANEDEWGVLQGRGVGDLDTPVVLKKGAGGAVYKSGDLVYQVTAPQIEVVDTSGAGEVLAGVFLALRAQGTSVENSLERAVHFASLSVTEPGIEHLRNK